MVEKHHNLRAQRKYFLHSLKLDPREVWKKTHNDVPNDTDRRQIKIHMKQNKHKINKEIDVPYYPIRYKKNKNLVWQIT